MGCDIHSHFEVKIQGIWEHYSTFYIKRDYTLFGRIAGVRNEVITPVVPPKGLPTGLSTITKIDVKKREASAHTFTWLNAKELSLLYHSYTGPDRLGSWKYCEDLGYLFGNSWHYFYKHKEDFPQEIEDIRFICWFEN